MHFEEILERVAVDRTSGAAKTLDYVAEALIDELSGHDIDASSAEWRSFALSLFSLRPTMAPIFHLANDILLLTEAQGAGRGEYLASLNEMLGRERMASERLVANSFEHLEGSRFLTISNSSSVSSALLGLSRRRQISAVVMRSMPGGEGEHAAELLSRHGIEVDLVDDSMVFEVAGE